MQPRTMFEKIWTDHVIADLGDGRYLVHIDRHVVHESTSREAFAGLRRARLRTHRPNLTIGVVDHAQSTLPGRTAESYPPTRDVILAMRENCRDDGIRLLDMDDRQQGIAHVIGPELGFALPGCTLVCGDSHTATNGGVGAWAWGIGTSEVEQVLATQMLVQRKPKTMRVTFTGTLGDAVFAKDLVLHLIGQHGIAAGVGHAVEYAGPAVRRLSLEGRLTICNMSIEFGARSGFMAPDDTVFDYLAGRPFSPKAELWDQALAHWRTIPSDDGAAFDREIEIDCDRIRPQVTWGISPQDVGAIDEPIPDPGKIGQPERRASIERALAYMDLRPGTPIEGVPIDYAFIGSCTNSRLSDLEAAARVVRGRKVPAGVTALVVPGSTPVKAAAEAAGLHHVFREAGFEWREAGCSMCVAVNGDIVPPGKRCISTSNRNFENRQGPRSRTHLASPATVAASAVSGRIADVRKLPH